MEAAFRKVRGVEQAVSGYTGGETADPAYDEVCSGATGHAEAVQIIFDPEIITFEELLELFWHVHDPTTLNRQGADQGTQYRSAIFYHTEAQQIAAEQSKQKAGADGTRAGPIVTEIVPFTRFYPAEEYHQNYHYFNRMQGYCRMVIDPKLRRLQRDFPDRLKDD